MPVPPAAPAVLPEPPPPSPVTNVVSVPPVADATLVTLDVVLSGQRGIPYEGTVRVDFFDMYKQYTSVRQTKQVHGEPALRFSNMPPIDCQITARLNSYLTTTTNVPLAEDAGTIKTVTLQISPARELRGTVVDAKTKTPLGYAGVALIAGGTNTACCDAAGAFIFSEVQDQVASLLVWHEDYPTQQFSIFVPPGGTSSAMLELVRAARIFGHVYDVSGRPVTACSVSYFVYFYETQSDQQQHANTITDANGYFDFPHVMPNEKLCVDAQAGNARGSVKVAVRAGEQRELQIVVTNRPPPPSSNGWIRVIARDTAGVPVTNANVCLLGGGFSMVGQTSKAGGECVAKERVGTFDILLTCDGVPPLVLTNVVVRYQETTTVHAVIGTVTPPVFGEVRRANGKPAVGISIMAESEDKRAGIIFGAQTDAHGEFTIPVVRLDFMYKLTSRQVVIDQPREPVKPGDFVHVVLKPYSAIQLQAVASNSLQNIAELGCAFAREPQGAAESENHSNSYEGSIHKLFLPSSGAYCLTIKAKGYKPVMLQRTFLPDEDVNLGTVYFEKEAPE
ncbi:MAG: hypothetical protein NTV22_07145 [bacterium]|nr:hypothetical protein [bacterium]